MNKETSMNDSPVEHKNEAHPDESGNISRILTKADIRGILDIRKISESKHFIYYGKDDSIIPEDEMNSNDMHLSIVCTRLGFGLPSKKPNYLYLTDKNPLDIRGGFPMTKDNLIVSAKGFNPHEITHFLVQNNLGFSHPVLDEGIAVLNGWGALKGDCVFNGRSIDYWMKIYQEVNIIPDMQDFFNGFRGYTQEQSYPIAAYFVRNILNGYGTGFFKRFFKRLDEDMSFDEIRSVFEEMTHNDIANNY